MVLTRKCSRVLPLGMLDKNLLQTTSARLYFCFVIGIGNRHQTVVSGGELNLFETLLVRQVFLADRYAAMNTSIGGKGIEVDVMDIILQHVVLSISIVLEADCNVHTIIHVLLDTTGEQSRHQHQAYYFLYQFHCHFIMLMDFPSDAFPFTGKC